MHRGERDRLKFEGILLTRIKGYFEPIKRPAIDIFLVYGQVSNIIEPTCTEYPGLIVESPSTGVYPLCSIYTMYICPSATHWVLPL